MSKEGERKLSIEKDDEYRSRKERETKRGREETGVSEDTRHIENTL